MPKAKTMPVDWRWITGFVLQFLVLFGTLLWKGGAIQSDLTNLKEKVDYQQKILDSYFRK